MMMIGVAVLLVVWIGFAIDCSYCLLLFVSIKFIVYCVIYMQEILDFFAHLLILQTI